MTLQVSKKFSINILPEAKHEQTEEYSKGKFTVSFIKEALFTRFIYNFQY